MTRFLPAFALATALSLGSSAAIAAEHGGGAGSTAAGTVVARPFAAVTSAFGDFARAWGLRSPHHRRVRSASAGPHDSQAKPIPMPRPKPDAAPSARSDPPTRSAGAITMPPVVSLE